MSDNDTTQPDPVDDIRTRLEDSSPLPWTDPDIRALLAALDETDTKYRRVCKAMADGQQAAQDILDSRNALAGILRHAQGLTDDLHGLSEFITEVTNQLFAQPEQEQQ